MARVASCPQCEHDLLVPDDAEPSALVKCPQCRAFFELQHAESRELPAALVVQSHTASTIAEPKVSKTPTVSDFSSVATLGNDVEPVSEEELKAASETDTLDFLNDTTGTDFTPPTPPVTPVAEQSQELKPAGSESHEEAAQRIDQWFRSAKTLSDLEPLSEGDLVGSEADELLERSLPKAESAPEAPSEIMQSDSDFSDYELETESDVSSDTPAWDDSQHMDRLLADFEEKSPDTYEPSADEYEPIVQEEAELPHEEQEHFQSAGDWTPDESLAIPTAPDKPERKRSVVRMLLVSAFGGLIGLGLGYYALLWLGPALNRGKDIDFLQVAQYLPKAVLPPAFKAEPKKLPSLPPSKMADDIAAAEKAAKSEPVAPAEPVAPPATDTTAAKTPAEPAEKQASFTTPAEPPKKPADTDDRYPIPAAKSDEKNEQAMHEPAPLDAPPAKSITETTPKVEPVRIVGAPSFAAADVATSLAAASTAEPGLVNGSLQDGKEVARTKGASYMTIADFAQKATFADAADASKSQTEADAFFRKLLANTHTRDEVAQIVPRWLSHPKRPQNGVFLAGSVKHVDVTGSVVEFTVELNGGPSVVVVVPVTDRSASISTPKGPVAVFGSIIDKPSEQVPGYIGKAPQVVFAQQLLPLE